MTLLEVESLDIPRVTQEDTTGPIAKAVKDFIDVRDKRRRLKKDFTDSDLPLMEEEQILTGTILAHLDANGLNSANTDYGTCYKSERATASLQDPHIFMEHVIANKAFELLERKANVTAVKTYIEEHDVPPPGVNYRVMTTLGVQKPRSK